MTKIKLTYFDMNGGRAEPARLALAMGGLDYEDDRISFEEFEKMRGSTPFNSVPTMEIDGRVITQFFDEEAAVFGNGAEGVVVDFTAGQDRHFRFE